MSTNDATQPSATHGSRSRREDWILWLVVLIPPVIWALRFLIVYPLVYVSCVTGTSLLINLISVAATVITTAAGVVAWRNWKRLTAGDRAFTAGPRSRPEAMAFSGVLFSGFFLSLILLEWSPVFFINPCEAGL